MDHESFQLSEQTESRIAWGTVTCALIASAMVLAWTFLKQ